jgi:DNA polymerase III delta prime subunit
MFENITAENLHHGYLIVGDRESNKNSLLDFLQNNLEISTVGNPDFSFTEYNTLNIEDARGLTDTQSRKDFGGSKKIFILATHIITEEAQNALLKVFEEPTVGTHFFILATQNNFLPTFLSRLQVIRPTTVVGQELSHESILDMPIADRLALVAKLAGDISDEKKVKQDAVDLVVQIEDELVQKNNPEKFVKELKECEFARNALFSRGAMTKMILENLMLQI